MLDSLKTLGAGSTSCGVAFHCFGGPFIDVRGGSR
jgi:hypothetical protein